MMRFIVLYTVFVCLGFYSVKSQSPGFNKLYDYNFKWQTFQAVLETYDSGFIAVGVSNDFIAPPPDNYLSFYIVKVDINGDTLFTKLYGRKGEYMFAGWVSSAIHTIDGNFAFGGSVIDTSGSSSSQALLVKFDNNGDTLWTKRYGIGNNKDVAYRCRQSIDGSYVLIGFTQVILPSVLPPDVYIIKTDSLGNMLWQKTFGGSKKDIGYSIEITKDDGYIIGATVEDITGSGWIIKTDSSGNKIWQKIIDLNIKNMGILAYPCKDGNYIVYSTKDNLDGNKYQGYIAKLDSTGQTIIWESTFGGPNNDSFVKVLELDDGSFIVTGVSMSNSYNKEFGWLMKVSSKGDSIWSRTYYTRPEVGSLVNDVEKAINGGFIMAGTAFDSTQDGWLVKVDSLGCIIPGCDTIATGLIQKIIAAGEMHIYPNPITNHAWAEAILPPEYKNDECYVQLIDIHGREVRRIPLYPDALGRTRVRINRNGLGAGMYFYRLVAGGEALYTGKVVIQ